MLAVQPGLAFPSLDFQNRATLAVHEVAAKLRVTSQHVFNLIRSGEITEEPSKQGIASRGIARISVEVYRAFVASRTVGQVEFITPPRLALGSHEFPTAAPLMFGEVSLRLGFSREHVGGLVFAGDLCALDLRGDSSTRATWRVPIEAYRHFVASRMTGPRAA